MALSDEDVARVRAATDAVQVVGEHVGLRKVGLRWVGLCPFHAEKTPSFSVNAEQGLYYCFGCGKGGDVITFVRELEHLTFVEAVEKLAAKAGVVIQEQDETATRHRRRRSQLTEAMERAVAWYHERLLTAPDANAARSYLRNRGYDGEVVRAFSLGWAPDDWDALARALRLSDDVLRDSGLGLLNRRGRQQDAFRGRLLFPIFDAAGRPVAFGGRILPGADGPKYRNSNETPLYAKSRTLYGLNWAKQEVVRTREVVMCEGYTDVIGFHQAGVERAVATCGTAVTADHIELLARNYQANRVVLAYDADAAGQRTNAEFATWEKRYGLEVAVLALPPGDDPADLARRDPEGLRRAVAEARPFVEYRLDRVFSAADLRSREGRARAENDAMAILRGLPEARREQYVNYVADYCRVTPERLRTLAAQGPPPTQRTTAPQPARHDDPAARRPEVMALRLLVHRPEEMGGRVDEALFTDEVVVEAVRLVLHSPSPAVAMAEASPDTAELLQRLLVEEDDHEVSADDVLSILCERAARRALGDVEARARLSEWSVELAQLHSWLRAQIEQLHEADTRADAVDRLVAWLGGGAEEGG